jgi:hypothetical protein|tara:strand:+ start:105 stop:332 length:228 start_codon:yes stop_codon:yes gene_type:complete
MKKFEVSFYDTFEEETEEGVYDALLNYLQEVVKHQDVTAFQVFEITKVVTGFEERFGIVPLEEPEEIPEKIDDKK